MIRSHKSRIDYRLACDETPAGETPGHVLVHVVVNVEAWALEDPMPRQLLSPPHGKNNIPDVPNFSWAEYGLRCGMPRLFDALSRFGIPASCAINAAVIDLYPELAHAIKHIGWEIIGHGYKQKSLDDADEEQLVAATIQALSNFFETDIAGWLSPGLSESWQTPDLLTRNKIQYLCDWALDDVTFPIRAEHGDLVGLPYSLELNDSVMFAVQSHASGEWLDRVQRTVDYFRSLGGTRILTLGLHPHLIGVPHRFSYFLESLSYLAAADNVEFMNGSTIVRHFDALHKETAGLTGSQSKMMQSQ